MSAVASSPRPPLSPQEQVREEGRLRPRFAVIAGLGGIALVGGFALQTAVQPKVSELTVVLLTANRRAGAEISGQVINGIGFLALGLTLSFLHTAAKARRQELTQAPRLIALAGGGLAALGAAATGVIITIKAHQFATSSGPQGYVQANDLVGGGALAVLQYLGLIGSLLLAIAFVLVSLNAMRVGLLTRFLGYLGMVAAAASLLLIGSAPALLVEVFWMLAIAYLLSGRWTTGEPEAWRSGKAEPWPSSAEVREQRQRGSGGGGARAKPAARKPSAPAAPSNGGNGDGAAGPARTRATTPKRKRKRRK